MGTRLRARLVRLCWSAGFVAVVLTPLGLVVAVAEPDRKPWALELSLTLGVLAFSLLVAAMVLPSRVRSLTRAFGIEWVLRSHRWLGLVVLALVVLHVLFVVLADPQNVALLDPRAAPNRARAAVAATLALAVLCLLSLGRQRLRLNYEIWRFSHVIAASIVLIGTVLHIVLLDHLIRDAAMRWFFAVAVSGLGLLLINRWVRRPLRRRRHAFVVHRVRAATPTASLVTLRPARRSHRGLRFRPGQFVWLRLDHPFSPRESHPFTISSGAHEPRLIEFTIRRSGDYTTELARAEPGRRVYLEGPHGAFTMDLHSSRSLLLIAGGVGIAPMMSMLRTLAHRGDPRLHRLVVAARSIDDLLFRDEIAALGSRLRLRVHEVLETPPPGWRGATGYVSDALLEESIGGRMGRRELDVFVCGPPAMVTAMQAALDRLGIPPQRIHTELFDLPWPPAPRPAGARVGGVLAVWLRRVLRVPGVRPALAPLRGTAGASRLMSLTVGVGLVAALAASVIRAAAS